MLPDILIPDLNNYDIMHNGKGITFTNTEKDWLCKAVESIKNKEQSPLLVNDIRHMLQNLNNFEPLHSLLLIDQLHKTIQNENFSQCKNYEKFIAEFFKNKKLTTKLETFKDREFKWLKDSLCQIPQGMKDPSSLPIPSNSPNLIECARNDILNKFNAFGDIGAKEIPLILAAKMSTKNRKNSVFFIKDNQNKDIDLMVGAIKNLLISNARKIIKFQIVLKYAGSHYLHGAFEIDKASTPYKVKYLHFETIVDLCEPLEVLTNSSIKMLSQFAKIEIYDATIHFQKGLGCSYFALDGALMQSVTSNDVYNVNIMEYMAQNGKKTTEKDYTYITSSTLPPRYIRGMQVLNDSFLGLQSQFLYIQKSIIGLESRVLNNPIHKDTIVNKKGDTAKKSIRDNSNLDIDDMSVPFRNNRAENKMKNYKKAVAEFIKDKNVLSSEFSTNLKNFQIEGLIDFCNSFHSD